MNKPTIYTLGYGKKPLAEIRALAEQLNALVVDVRYSPRSRKPEYNKSGFERVLNESYVHVPELGNLNYKNGGPIEIADYEEGVMRAVTFAEARGKSAIILMCVCWNPVTCHRTTVAERMQADGFTVLPLPALTGPVEETPKLVQMELF